MTETTITGWLAHHPEVLALGVLLVGWYLARLARRGVSLGAALSNRLVARLGSRTTALMSPALERAAQTFVFWAVLLSAVVFALRLLGIDQMSTWLDDVLARLPQILISIVIVAVGHVMGLLLRNLLSRYDTAAGAIGQLPRIVYAVVLTIAIVTALEQLGVNVSFVTQVALVVVTVFLGGLALAFALGARQLVANLTARTEIERYTSGERLRIDGLEGTVVEVHRTGLVLATDDGLTSIPASMFSEHPVVRLSADTEDQTAE